MGTEQGPARRGGGRRPITAETIAHRQEFGDALGAALRAAGMSQADLGLAIGEAQSTVSAWLAGVRQPSVDTVWRLEEVLGFAPGGLSRLLGYLPVSAVEVVDVERAIELDPTFTPMQRELLRLQLKAMRNP